MKIDITMVKITGRLESILREISRNARTLPWTIHRFVLSSITCHRTRTNNIHQSCIHPYFCVARTIITTFIISAFTTYWLQYVLCEQWYIKMYDRCTSGLYGGVSTSWCNFLWKKACAWPRCVLRIIVLREFIYWVNTAYKWKKVLLEYTYVQWSVHYTHTVEDAHANLSLPTHGFFTGCFGFGLYRGFSPPLYQWKWRCVSIWTLVSSVHMTSSKERPMFRLAHTLSIPYVQLCPQL